MSNELEQATVPQETVPQETVETVPQEAVPQETVPLNGMVFDGASETVVHSAADLTSALSAQSAFAYVEVQDAGHQSFPRLVAELGLAVDNHVALSARRIELEVPAMELAITDLRVYVLDRVLVIAHDGSFDAAGIVRRWNTERRHRDQGVGYLLWILLDELLAEMTTALEALDQELDDIEDDLLAPAGDAPTPSAIGPLQHRIYRLRKAISQLRRCALPMRDSVDSLLRREADCVSPALFPLFQGLYDRGVHLTEWADSVRDMVTALSDTQIAMDGNRLNVSMKKITSWAAIIAVPAGVTGFYGQNLPYPGFNTVGGLWTSVLLMVGGCVALYVTFKRKDWL